MDGSPEIILRTLVFGRERRWIDEDNRNNDDDSGVKERRVRKRKRVVGRRGYRIIANGRNDNKIERYGKKDFDGLDCRLAVSRGRDEGKFAENPRESKSLR